MADDPGATQSEMDRASKIIDRLLRLMPYHDYNAVDDALMWLLEHDHDNLLLTAATRYQMNAFNPASR